MSHCYITLNETLLSHCMSNCFVTLEKLSLCDIVIAITSRMNNITVKFIKVFLIVVETFPIDLKMLFNAEIEPYELYTLMHIKFDILWYSFWKIRLTKLLLHISHSFLVWLQLHLQFLTKWYIFSWRFQQQSCSVRWDLSFDIHIGGGPGGVFNFTISNLGEGGIKNWLRIRIQGPWLPPGRSRKVKNLTINN